MKTSNTGKASPREALAGKDMLGFNTAAADKPSKTNLAKSGKGPTNKSSLAKSGKAASGKGVMGLSRRR